MSGGSYDYAYSKIDELSSWASTLDSMAAECRKWATETETKDVYDRETRTHTARNVPLTIEDRARIMVGAIRLENAAKKARAAYDALVEVKELMRDVEWISSCDTSVDTVFLDPK